MIRSRQWFARLRWCEILQIWRTFAKLTRVNSNKNVLWWHTCVTANVQGRVNIWHIRMRSGKTGELPLYKQRNVFYRRTEIVTTWNSSVKTIRSTQTHLTAPGSPVRFCARVAVSAELRRFPPTSRKEITPGSDRACIRKPVHENLPWSGPVSFHKLACGTSCAGIFWNRHTFWKWTGLTCLESRKWRETREEGETFAQFVTLFRL